MANTFPFSDPIGVSLDSAHSIGLEAIDHRRGQGGLSQPMYGNTFGTLSGVFPGGTTGAGIHNDLGFTGASGLTVNFNAGHYACDRGTGNLFLGMAYAGWSLNLDSGDAVNPRIDMIVIRVRDPGPDGLDAGSNVSESARPTVLKGSPAASPSKPTGQLTNGDVPLWSFTVGGGSNANAIIANQDERLSVVARGGIYPRPAWDTRPGAYEGQYRDNEATKSLERWNGSVWDAVASPAVWNQFTPALYSSGGKCSLGSGGIAAGYYIIVGKILHLRYTFYAQPGVNMGYGAIYTYLPPGLIAARYGEQHIYCKINCPVPQTQIYMGECFVAENQTIMQPYFPLSSTNNVIGYYKAADQAGVPDHSVPYIPNGFADPAILCIQGTLEIQ